MALRAGASDPGYGGDGDGRCARTHPVYHRAPVSDEAAATPGLAIGSRRRGQGRGDLIDNNSNAVKALA